jgi:hypothetical protein
MRHDAVKPGPAVHNNNNNQTNTSRRLETPGGGFPVSNNH